MGEPLPSEPDEKPEPDAPRPAIERADWLVGSDDGLTAELERHEKGEVTPLPTPRLVRPQLPEGQTAPSNSRSMGPFPGRPPMPPAPSTPTMPAWDAGANSVPMMRRPAGLTATGVSGVPETARDFPMDDAEERARVAAQVAEQQAREAAIAARPHEVVKPHEFELPVVEQPWWAQVPEALRTDRRVQLAVLLPVLVLLVMTAWPRAEKTISVAHLKEHSERYADTPVRVGGRVGEVFPVGGSWAYTLVQGRDTIVVFTRTHRPRPREKLVVVGTLSTGYLDGQSRVAIFEATR